MCDDGGPGAEFALCDFGSDCTDCGPRTGEAPPPLCWVDTPVSMTPPLLLLGFILFGFELARIRAAILEDRKLKEGQFVMSPNSIKIVMRALKQHLTSPLSLLLMLLMPGLYVIGITTCPREVRENLHGVSIPQVHFTNFEFLTLSVTVAPLIALIPLAYRVAKIHKRAMARLDDIEKATFVDVASARALKELSPKVEEAFAVEKARAASGQQMGESEAAVDAEAADKKAEAAAKKAVYKKFTRTGGLEEVLRSGTIVLLSVEWLLRKWREDDREDDKFILLRRQELPDEAIVPSEQAVTLLRNGEVAALSYRWLESHHPDPSRHHLDALGKYLSDYPSDKLRWTGLMIDFASLPQKDSEGLRSPVEQLVFEAALNSMSSFYASPRVAVLQHKAMPTDNKERMPYDRSGWCTFEQAVARLATVQGGAIFNLVTTKKNPTGRVRLQPGKHASADQMDEWFHRSDVHFFGAADRDIVSAMYRDLLSRVDAFDAAARMIERRANEMLTTKPSKLRRSVCPFIIIATLASLILVQASSPPLPALVGFLWFLVFMIVVVKLTQAPIMRAHLGALYDHVLCHPADPLDHKLKCSLRCLFCCAPMFREHASPVAPESGDVPMGESSYTQEL